MDFAAIMQELIAWVTEFFATIKDFVAGWEKHFAFETATDAAE